MGHENDSDNTFGVHERILKNLEKKIRGRIETDQTTGLLN